MRCSVRLRLALVAVCLSAGCGSGEKVAQPPAEKVRTLASQHAAVASAFAAAVASRNYELAYAHMSEWYKRDIGHEEFLKSISRYRDGYETAPTFSVEASDDDPAELKDDPVMTLLVGDAALRAEVQEEAIIEFRAGEDGWTLVAWLIQENGQIRILNYVQDD